MLLGGSFPRLFRALPGRQIKYSSSMSSGQFGLDIAFWELWYFGGRRGGKGPRCFWMGLQQYIDVLDRLHRAGGGLGDVGGVDAEDLAAAVDALQDAIQERRVAIAFLRPERRLEPFRGWSGFLGAIRALLGHLAAD